MTSLVDAPRPDVSIILPVFNDEAWVLRSLQSCVAQTLDSIEIIVVDDASTDATASIADDAAREDSRVRVLRQTTNGSAFNARRVGIEAARSDFIMFLDGDDELEPDACRVALERAKLTGAELVGFGCVVVAPDGTTGGRYEASMQPVHPELSGESILPTLMPVGRTAQGQLWRYLFSRPLLQRAYADFPQALSIPRMNDLPIAFLAQMYARHYVSIPDRLYRYHFGRGASGQVLDTWDDYRFNEAALVSVESIENTVEREAARRTDPTSLLAAFSSAQSSVIARVLSYVAGITDPDFRRSALVALMDRVGRLQLVQACGDFLPSAQPLLTDAFPPPPLSGQAPTHVILRSGNLRTGGVQGVVVSQAEVLVQQGIAVTIVVDNEPVSAYDLPPGVDILGLAGETRGQRIGYLASLCLERSVDVVIDHHIFYNDRWPIYTLALSAVGVSTIGWIHNFALRPMLDGVTSLSFMERHLPELAAVVVLSRQDVAYWKLRGIDNVVYLPNPPSQMVHRVTGRFADREAPSGKLDIVWWGRLQQGTKQVLDLVDLGVELRKLQVDFSITIVGPDGPDLSAVRVRRNARKYGLEQHFVLPGELHKSALAGMVENAHVFVNTSVVEGYPLALVEAEALGLPIVMYDLPWLEFTQDNPGIVSVRQGDRVAMARALAEIANQPELYDRLTDGALAAARAELEHDLGALYLDLLQGRLDPSFSPDPTLESARLLLGESVRFVERLQRTSRRHIRRSDDTIGTLSADLAATKRELTDRRKEVIRKLKGIDSREAKIAELSAALSKARKQLSDSKLSQVSAVAVKKVTDTNQSLQRSAPRKPRIATWLQRFLPATMRQTNHQALHGYQTMSRQHDQLVNQQAELSAQLARIEARLDDARR